MYRLTQRISVAKQADPAISIAGLHATASRHLRLARAQPQPLPLVARAAISTPACFSSAAMDSHRRRRPRGGRSRGPSGRFQPVRLSSSAAAEATAPAPAPAPASAPSSSASFSDQSFEVLADVLDPKLLSTLVNDLKMERMTPVQAETLPVSLRGTDILAQARTGTGKTLAFLLPAIQKLVTTRKAKSNQLSTVIITPTRELAMQIAKEAQSLLQNYPQYTVRCAIGGTNPAPCFRRSAFLCDMLIATPGRVLDHLTNPDPAFREQMSHVQTVVLDEADRLMDMGFLAPIKKILSHIPTSKAQGMLFSATIGQHVHHVSSLVLSKDHKYINTIPVGEPKTHETVPQRLIVAHKFSDLPTALVGALVKDAEKHGRRHFKVIVFLSTSGGVTFHAALLNKARQYFDPSGEMEGLYELHSRLSQSARTKIVGLFQEARNGILIATDVAARGLDFPGVTEVYQVGLPQDQESYTHRLGRTARAGAQGRGTLIVASPEAGWVNSKLGSIKFKHEGPELDLVSSVQSIAAKLEPERKAKAYRAWLGYYKGFMKPLKWTPQELVRQGNELVIQGFGALEVPELPKQVVGKMGLKGVAGVRVEQRVEQ